MSPRDFSSTTTEGRLTWVSTLSCTPHNAKNRRTLETALFLARAPDRMPGPRSPSRKQLCEWKGSCSPPVLANSWVLRVWDPVLLDSNHFKPSGICGQPHFAGEEVEADKIDIIVPSVTKCRSNRVKIRPPRWDCCRLQEAGSHAKSPASLRPPSAEQGPRAMRREKSLTGDHGNDV